MRLRVVRPLRTRSVVASFVETAVAMVTTVAVTVLFFALVAFPESVHAHTALDTAYVAACTGPAALTA